MARPRKPSAKNLEPRDRRELARLLGKYGRETIVAVANDAKALPLPRKRGRPRGSVDPSKDAAEIAEFIWRYANIHRASGSKKPVYEALMDLYEVTENWRERPKDLETWCRTILRKRRAVRRTVEAYLEHAKATAGRVSGGDKSARINRRIYGA